MLKILLVALLPLVILFGIGLNRPSNVTEKSGQQGSSGTLEKLIVADGEAVIDINTDRLGGKRTSRTARTSQLRFSIEPDSFFAVVVFNGELRGPLPSSMKMIPQGFPNLAGRFGESYENLIVETLPLGGPYEMAIRDGRTGFTFFNVEGHQFDYASAERRLGIQLGRLLLSDEYAAELGRAGDANSLVGQISIKVRMRPIEVSHVVDGEVENAVLPASPEAGTVPGPDVVVGDLNGLAQFGGSSGSQVGLAVGTDSCNFGTVDLNWFANPANDHPVIPQNMYRMSANGDRFEQIGQSSVKHAFLALTQNICTLGCNGVGGSRLGSGCSDPYGASLNAGPNLGSRAWINPFTGAFPRNDSPTPNNSHGDHTHTGPSHRILTEIADLSTTLNPGATYYAEGQYITPHEYAWCQLNPTQCNQYNNVSHRRYSVNGTGSPFTFSPVGGTVRQKAAITAWTGSTLVEINPAPGLDGIGTLAYKVTNPSPGVWHYEYAIYNQNIDRGINSFSVPIGGGITLSNVGFHAPPQHPGWSGDGTVSNAGFSSSPWSAVQAGGAVTWSSESFATNQNGNALRWGTLYNFRFDSNRPPTQVNATVGFFKTGSPVTLQVMGPSPAIVNVSVSGRVTSSTGQGLARVHVFIMGAGGVSRTTLTNTFGFFVFDGVAAGQSYTIGATSPRYTFPAPAVVPVNDHVSGLNISAQP
jgi:hypothetical protein